MEQNKDLVMIVDDSEYNRSLLSDIIADEFIAVEAADGKQAVEILDARNDIKLVLLDLVMPQMNGYEVLAHMQKSGTLASIPVITILPERSVSNIKQAYDMGATEYISRPFDERAVKRRIRNTIALCAKQSTQNCTADAHEHEKTCGMASKRTLELLEQERTKYLFYALMSREILFEFDRETRVLKLSEWGAEQLGLSEVIENPQDDKELRKVFSAKDYADLRRRLRAVDRSDPIVSRGYYLNVRGQKRWFKAVARPLWTDDGKMSGTIGKFVDEHAQHEEYEKLKDKTKRDSLTKLYNHETLRSAAKSRIPESGSGQALALMDMDGFKSVNDRFGHLFGNKILCAVADRITENLSGDDMAARVGGDEFLLLIGQGDNVRKKIKDIFDSLRLDYEGCGITLSMGVSLCPENGTDYEDLFHKADQALYHAKQNGRNKCVFYSDDMDVLPELSPMDN